MTLPDSSPVFESSPTAEDVARAEGWILAIESSAAIWTLLSPEQQRMVRARIAWALSEFERPSP